jgi:hypothetical protein
MSTAREQACVPVAMCDYLDEDPPIRRQNFVCLSFLSPDDVIEDKTMFVLKDFLASFSKSMVVLTDHLRSKFPDSAEDVDAIVQTHATIFQPESIGADLDAYQSINKAALDKAYETKHDFRTNVRGVKVRGVFATRDEAEKHIKSLKRDDTAFDIYLAEVGKWCPWAPCPEDIEEVEYAETHLNTLMKGYKQNLETRDDAYVEDTTARINKAKPKVTADTASTSAGAGPADATPAEVTPAEVTPAEVTPAEVTPATESSAEA